MTDGKEVSCEVCMDLIPLVRDGAASEESRELVERHAEGCEACRVLLREESPAVLERERDRELIKRLKRPLFWIGVVLMVIGAAVGTAYTYSTVSGYSLIIMPLLGVLGTMLFGKRWWWMPVGQLLFSGVWLLIYHLIQDVSRWWAAVLAAGIYALLYALLVTAGALMALLLRYAFRRRGAAEKLRLFGRRHFNRLGCCFMLVLWQPCILLYGKTGHGAVCGSELWCIGMHGRRSCILPHDLEL